MPLVTCPCEEMAPMKQVQREGIEIDVCTKCRGVWLDRGELEKLLAAVQKEADASFAPAPTPPQAAQPAPQPQAPPPQAAPYPPQPGYPPQAPHAPWGGERGEYGERGEGYYDPRYGYYKKKKRFDIFDIFD